MATGCSSIRRDGSSRARARNRSEPACSQKFKPQVTRTDLRTGKMEVLADNYQGKPFVGPERRHDRRQGPAVLHRSDRRGRLSDRRPGQLARILAAPDIQRPNGIQISPDDKQLYLIEANGAAGRRAHDPRVRSAADGTVGNMRVHYNFYPGRSADGMSIDTQGNLYASAGMNQLRGTSETLDTKTGVYVISPQGKLLKFIPIPEDFITNNAFGGPDMKTLYVTAGKTLYKAQLTSPGCPVKRNGDYRVLVANPRISKRKRTPICACRGSPTPLRIVPLKSNSRPPLICDTMLLSLLVRLNTSNSASTDLPPDSVKTFDARRSSVKNWLSFSCWLRPTSRPLTKRRSLAWPSLFRSCPTRSLPVVGLGERNCTSG